MAVADRQSSVCEAVIHELERSEGVDGICRDGMPTEITILSLRVLERIVIL